MNRTWNTCARFVASGLVCFAAATAAGTARGEASAESEEPNGVLTLREALALALARNPELAAISAGIRAADAQTTQAALRRNPEIGVDVENVGGTSPGFAASELTLSLGQLIELGGKRTARIAASQGESAVLRIDYEAARLALVYDVTLGFLDGLAIEQSVGIADAALHAAAETDSVMRIRVLAGASSAADQARAEADFARARLARETLDSERALARSRIARLWGSSAPRFTGFGGPFDSIPSVPTLDSLLAHAAQSPELARWEAEIAAREAELRFERANAAPDLQLGAGYRYLPESDDHAFLAGVAIPLRLFDRNQGNVAAAAAKSDRASAGFAGAAIDRRATIAQAHIALVRESARIETLRRTVLPTTERAFHEVRAGFERGRFSYLDLLEARRSWIDARGEELESVIEFHRTRTQLERLIAGPLGPLATEETR